MSIRQVAIDRAIFNLLTAERHIEIWRSQTVAEHTGPVVTQVNGVGHQGQQPDIPGGRWSRPLRPPSVQEAACARSTETSSSSSPTRNSRLAAGGHCRSR